MFTRKHIHIYDRDGTYEWYYIVSYDTPSYTGTFKIEKAWEDSENNVWFIVWRSYRGDSWALNKISNDGNLLEYVRVFNREHLPTKIDPDNDGYYKMVRKKKE